MGLSFVAVDFETANAFRGSPCAVGLVRVENGVVTARETWLMRPPAGYDEFDPFNVEIHGITRAMVKGEPRFAERLPGILEFAGDLPLVAHNAAFDVGVLRDACVVSDLPWPPLRYACTLVVARQTYDLLSYSLPWVADGIGFTFDHHEPGADAEASAAILLDIADRREADDLEGLLAHARCAMGWVQAGEWSGCHHHQPGDGANRPPEANPDADPSHPFYGREMVFTGALSSMTRQRAWDLVAERGGLPAPGVTKHTAMLVVGYQDARKLSPGATLSAKAQKAQALRARGQQIELLPEVDFVQALDL